MEEIKRVIGNFLINKEDGTQTGKLIISIRNQYSSHGDTFELLAGVCTRLLAHKSGEMVIIDTAPEYKEIQDEVKKQAEVLGIKVHSLKY